MKLVDVASVGFVLTKAEILVANQTVVTNPEAFVKFIEGLKLGSGALSDARVLAMINGVQLSFSGGVTFHQQVLHYVVPKFYDVKYLAAIGGRFVLRITGVADYNISVFLGRVLVMNGGAVEPTLGHLGFDSEIRADAFIAVCNGLLGDLCESTLENLETQVAHRQIA